MRIANRTLPHATIFPTESLPLDAGLQRIPDTHPAKRGNLLSRGAVGQYQTQP